MSLIEKDGYSVRWRHSAMQMDRRIQLKMGEIRFDSAVVILGSHRSGTAALAGVLHSCGLSVPRDTISPSGVDTGGGWESEVIISLNDAIFEAIGSNWLSLEPVSPLLPANGAASEFDIRTREALSSQFRAGEVPLINDPRICRLMPFWEPALSILSARLAYAIIVRHPVEVAHSLVRRVGIDFDHALLLWARYYFDAEAATRGKRRAFISCADLLDDWRKAIGSLQAALDLPLDMETVGHDAIDRSLSRDRLDEMIAGEASLEQAEHFPIVTDAFRILDNWVRGAVESEIDYLTLDEARARLDKSRPPSSASDGVRSVFTTPCSTAGESANTASSPARGQLQNEQQEHDASAVMRSQLGTIRVRDDELAAVSNELRAVSEELGKVKRKYRSTQAILTRERKALKESRANLARAEAIIARYRRSFLWHFYTLITTLLTYLRRLGQRLTGNTGAKRYERMIALLDQSSLFDRDWYLDAYPDVAATGIDPVRHYLDNGWREGRDPGPGFSTNAYLKAHADVAANGTNPLLHYVEYGHSEGRGAPEHAAPRASSIVRRDVGPAAPCASFAVADQPVVQWRRAGDLGSVPHMFTLPDGLAVGTLPDAKQAAAFRAAVARLALLSGASEGGTEELCAEDEPPCAVLLDAWHPRRNCLRSRWRRTNNSAPMVVRILQQVGGKPDMIGEGLVGDDLDLVDGKLINQYFPLLYVFADVDGRVLGWRFLAFPSLCRGGLHHDEFTVLAQGNGGDGDFCAMGDRIVNRLLAIRSGGARALISMIAVDLRGADGTHALFQPHFQKWLADVVRIPVKGKLTGEKSAPADYLRDGVRVSCDSARSRDAATLILGSDMVPSLTALAAISEKGESKAVDLRVPMIVSGEATGQPSLIAHMPQIAPDEAMSGHVLAFPVLSSESKAGRVGNVQAFAVRAATLRPLSDAELLVPISAPARGHKKAATPTTWMMWPGTWLEQDLVQSLEALAAQSDSGPISILFVGATREVALAFASRLFEGRVATAESLVAASALLNTPLVGFVGPSVVLHDRRTVHVLTRMLDDPRNMSASVALVWIEKRGKGFLVTPIDAGTTGEVGQAINADQLASSARALWRSSWPVSAPPRDLWLARADHVARWLAPTRNGVEEGIHACSAMVTASYCATPAQGPAMIVPAPAPADRALRIEVVV